MDAHLSIRNLLDNIFSLELTDMPKAERDSRWCRPDFAAKIMILEDLFYNRVVQKHW
jgi:hypothetical protein